MGVSEPGAVRPATGSRRCWVAAGWASSIAPATGLGRDVALKVIAPELVEDAEVRARFLREARAAAAIEHPNVIPVYAAGERDGVAFLAMRLVDGEDLRRRSARRPAGDRGRLRADRAGREGAGRDPSRGVRPSRRQARQPARRPLRARVPDRLRARQADADEHTARRGPGAGSGRSTTSRRSRSAAGASTPARTSTRSAASSTTS